MPTKTDMYAYVNNKKAVEDVLSHLVLNASDDVQDYLYSALWAVRDDIRKAEDFILTNEDWSEDDYSTNDLEIMFHQD
jgi:hypothetical protein